MKLEPDWHEYLLPQVLCSMRCTPAHATKIIPAEVLLNRKVVFPFEVERQTQRGRGTYLSAENDDILLLFL